MIFFLKEQANNLQVLTETSGLQSAHTIQLGHTHAACGMCKLLIDFLFNLLF